MKELFVEKTVRRTILPRLKKLALFLIMAPVLAMLNVTQGNYVELALGSTETTETNLGTITVPANGVSRIVGIYGIANVLTTTAENASGGFRLAFSTVAGVFKFPLNTNQGPAGTLVSPGWTGDYKIIPVNIPVPPNETITCYATLDVAQTGACRARVGVIFE